MPPAPCSATKADGSICARPAHYDGYCGTHERQRVRQLERRAEMDARENPNAVPNDAERCTRRLKTQARCTNRSGSPAGGMCTRCFYFVLETPFREARARLRLLSQQRPFPLREMIDYINELSRDGIGENYVDRLRRDAHFFWEQHFFQIVATMWQRYGEAGHDIQVRVQAITDFINELGLRENLEAELRNRLHWYTEHLAREDDRRVALQLLPHQELGRLAADRQNVHTKPVTKQMTEGIEKLVAADPGPTKSKETTTRQMIWNAFTDILGKNPESNEFKAVMLDMNSMWERSRSEPQYRKALRGLWVIINTYTGDTLVELIRRLWEECLESVNMCTQGHLARLTNVLIGYDDRFKYEEPVGDIIQRKMAEIAAMDVEYDEQIRLAEEALDELNVPGDKQREWLAAF